MPRARKTAISESGQCWNNYDHSTFSMEMELSMNLAEQLEYLFNPQSIAVIGASNTFGKWGFNIFNRVIATAAGRKVYPVNKYTPEVRGIPTFANVTEVPGPVDFAVLTVPSSDVPEAIQNCVDKGVKVAEIISGGFAEVGTEGRELERNILEIARRGNMRLVGPNTMGHLSTASGFYTAPWIRDLPEGQVALISQSGNFGVYITQKAIQMGIGFSKVVSSGNEADLRLEDYVEYLAQDTGTKVIAAYIEGLREGRRFWDLAREITKQKPIIVMKAGSTQSGARAAASHTGTLAGEDHIYHNAFKQSGVIRVREVDELLDVSGALLRQPKPKGRKVAVLSGGGGFGVIATDACERQGLEMSAISPSTMEKLNSVLSPRWSHANPIDMAGEGFLTYPCLLALLVDDNFDAVLTPAIGYTYLIKNALMDCMESELFERVEQYLKINELKELEDLDKAIELMDRHQKPLLISPSPGLEDSAVLKHLHANGILTFPALERAATVLAHLADYGEYLDNNGKGQS